MRLDDLEPWLADRAREHEVPGVSLALLADGAVRTAAAGILNVETGVQATPGSVFRVGSVTKVYTAVAAMRLVDDGRLDLDRPVVEALPEFRVADPDVTSRVTPRHLLSHMSGISGDAFIDTGRGDDALERYVRELGEVGQDVPLGTTTSYSNVGFAVVGRLIEVATGKIWDDALRELVLEPLGVEQTVTLPEGALRWRVSYGHEQVEPGEPPELFATWDYPRSTSPAGAIIATAEDVVTFGGLVVDGGVAPNGTRLLSEAAYEQMLRPHGVVADRWSGTESYGLGWQLNEWDGQRVVGHDGNLHGHEAMFTVVPSAGVAFALLTNGGRSIDLVAEVRKVLLRELCDIGVPEPPEPVPDSEPAGRDMLVGRYERYGSRMTVEARDGGLRATVELIEPLKSQMPDYDRPLGIDLHPSTAGPEVYVGHLGAGEETWFPCVFFELDGRRYVHLGGRSQPKVV